MATEKIKLVIDNIEFQLPKKCLVTKNRWNDLKFKPYINVDCVAAASLIKQYVKNRFPNVIVSSSSEKYSGGSSVNVYLCESDSTPLNDSDYQKIRDWADALQMGNFNGMYDIYEYRKDDVTTDNGTKLDCSSSYIFVNNRPKFGTKYDVARSVAEHIEAGKSLDDAITFLSRFHNQKVVNDGVELYEG